MLGLHGIAHLVGFLVPWRLIAREDGTYPTTILAGTLDLGANGIRAYGLVWLVAAATFATAALATWTGKIWWLPLVVVIAVWSLFLSLLSWPDSRIGVAINVAIVVWVVTGKRLGWF